jgi:hypothetical protein
MVGPFIFMDQMGPAEFRIGQGVDVRPHPHIGLATVTYLFDGEITHRDSLGNLILIRPGEVNLMIAGRGIAHSERTPPEDRASGPKLYGLQTWLALPKAQEEVAPAFAHHGRDELPVIDGEGKRVRLILGTLYGETSPVATLSETIYAEAVLAPGAVLPFDAEHEERGLYIVAGEIDIGGVTFAAGRLLVLRPGENISVLALSQARLMLVGGATMDGPRHIWWNFVSSSQDRIEAAKADKEFIPLP